MTKEKSEIEHLHARMIVFVGCTIAVTFAITVIGFVYGLLFVTQPLEQSPNDAAFLKILEPLMFSIGGALTGLAAGRAMSSGKKEEGE